MEVTEFLFKHVPYRTERKIRVKISGSWCVFVLVLQRINKLHLLDLQEYL